MGMRHRSIRLRVFLLVAIPILFLTGLYAFVADLTVGNAVSLARSRTVKNVIATPTTNLQVALNTERGLALVYLAKPSSRLLAELSALEAKTNNALQAFKNTVASPQITGYATVQEKQVIRQMVTQAGSLAPLRGRIAKLSVSRAETLAAYSNVVQTGFRVLDGAIVQQSSVPLVTQALAIIKLDEADQTVAEESDLLVGDLTAGSFPAADRQQFAQLVGERRSLIAQTLPEFSPAFQAYYRQNVTPTTASALTMLENKVISGRAGAHLPPPVDPDAWRTTATTYTTGFGKALISATNTLTAGARAQSRHISLQLILAGGLGLLAIVVSVIFSWLMGRSLIRPLAALRQAALDLANNRLPSVMQRLRAGQDVDVAAEAPLLDQDQASDEIGQVREAFNAVQRTAIEAAVDEARLRRGISDVFRNLARRSQSLLHRQLALLDGMERRASGPEELEDLFRIDHLTTRMRRHAEGLIILSGESPGRGWRNPVPLVDVLRAAIAEVEDYTRIRVVSRTQAALAGPAVADVIHLIAELAENATIYSPPNTPVRILGDVVGQGFAVEVEDRGLGIPEPQLSEINQNLAEPPQFDLSGSDRLGLFIAGQLARRHDIKITLRGSPFGGTTAIVLIPGSLVVASEAAGELTAGADRDLPLRLTGRHAVLSTAGDTDDFPAARPQLAGTPAAGGPAGAAPASGTATQAAPVLVPGAPVVPVARASGDREVAGTAYDVAGQGPSSGAGAAAFGQAAHADGPAPGGFFRPAQRKAADRADGTVSGPPWAPASPPPDGGTDQQADGGLPVRIRQASLAPQLRPDPPQGNGAGRDGAAGQGAGGQGAGGRPDGGRTGMGLPVRVRQASIAPQLRDGGTAGASATGSAAPPAGPPSPEAARNTFAALQRGWERGRSAAGSAPDLRPAPEPRDGGPAGREAGE
jgi:signal transduction histidine kinase